MSIELGSAGVGMRYTTKSQPLVAQSATFGIQRTACFLIIDERRQKHFIVGRKKMTGLMLAEGHWHKVISSDAYRRRQLANTGSYLWDKLIQKTCQNALDGTLSSTGNIFAGRSPVHEM